MQWTGPLGIPTYPTRQNPRPLPAGRSRRMFIPVLEGAEQVSGIGLPRTQPLRSMIAVASDRTAAVTRSRLSPSMPPKETME